MTSRERVRASINHQQPDKIPFDLGGTSVTTLHVSGVEGLCKYYGLPDQPVTVWGMASMAGRVPDALADAMGADVAAAVSLGGPLGLLRKDNKEWVTPYGQKVIVPGQFHPIPDGEGGWYACPQGDTTCKPSAHMPKGCVYFDNIEPETDFDEDQMDPADNLQEFGVLSDEDFAYIKNSVEAAYKTGRAVALNMPGTGLGDVSFITGAGLKHPKGIRKVADWYMAPLMYPEYVMEVFDRETDIALINLQKINEMCGDKIDVIFVCGTDFGHQNGLMVNPEVFREVWQPYYKKMNDWIHKNTQWKIMKHSCGSVRPLIPALIDSGFDILNPVQCSAYDMDPQTLKSEFGKDITFWGGGVDTQQVLPFGTPEEVRKQVLERCEIFSKDGGFIFNPIHIVQYGVPVENIVAMINAVKEFNGEQTV